jgi:hypothetical protein
MVVILLNNGSVGWRQLWLWHHLWVQILHVSLLTSIVCNLVMKLDLLWRPLITSRRKSRGLHLPSGNKSFWPVVMRHLFSLLHDVLLLRHGLLVLHLVINFSLAMLRHRDVLLVRVSFSLARRKHVMASDWHSSCLLLLLWLVVSSHCKSISFLSSCMDNLLSSRHLHVPLSDVIVLNVKLVSRLLLLKKLLLLV